LTRPVPIGFAIAGIMATPNKPQVVTMGFQKEYAERYDWLVTAFRDWAFTFFTSFLYPKCRVL